ncbi:MAG: hypothetical protein GY929_01635 [Actinomycetia bacterium]|nr:hypothetical protein [Actinomycetes bacterium]
MSHPNGGRLPILMGALALLLASCTSGSSVSGSGGAPRTLTADPTELARPATTTSTATTTPGDPTTTTQPGLRLSDAVATAVSDIYGPPLRDGSQGWGPPWGAHDEAIDVNPEYDFAGGARPAAWNDPPGLHIQPWCEVFRAFDGTPVTDLRIELRSYEYWELTDGEWHLVFSSDEEETEFNGFWGNSDVRSIGDAPLVGEGNGVWAIDWRSDAAMLHPWTNGRIQTSPTVEARVGRAQMRVTSGQDPTIDLDDVRLLGACTFDYYQSARGGEGPGVPSAVVPRHKYLTAQWRWFNTITMPASPPDSGWSLEAISEAVLENPPPLS